MPTEDAPLFEIFNRHLNTGLRGYPVGTCRTSAVDKDRGVSYGGYPILELANLSSEAVIHLLLYKRLPNEEEEQWFKEELLTRSEVPERVYELMSNLPKRGHPMEWLICGINFLAMCCKTGDWIEDGLNLIAKVNVIAASIFRVREGWGDPIRPREDLDYAANFAHMLGVPESHAELAELLRLFHVLHMDHGGGNLSTFTGKAIASGHAGVYVSMAGAMAALYGPLHGRANQECLQFVQEVGSSEPAAVETFVRTRLAEGGKIFGFGHAVLRAEDPRAKVQYDFGANHFEDNELVKTALTLREVVPKVLKESPKIQNPYPNVDAISGSLLYAAGLRKPEYFTVLFGWSRVVGIASQIIDERLHLRDGRGVPIYRPRFVAEDQPVHHLP